MAASSRRAGGKTGNNNRIEDRFREEADGVRRIRIEDVTLHSRLIITVVRLSAPIDRIVITSGRQSRIVGLHRGNGILRGSLCHLGSSAG